MLKRFAYESLKRKNVEPRHALALRFYVFHFYISHCKSHQSIRCWV